MKKIFLGLIIVLTFTACGGSRKTKVYEPIIITEVRDVCRGIPFGFSKYFGEGDYARRFKFVDTSGKFKKGDTIWPKFTKIR